MAQGREGKPRKVRDAMHTGDAVPRVETWMTLRDAVYEMARGRLGVTAVTDNAGRLVGCLSEDDFRRLLAHDDAFDGTAGECMTRDPRTVDGDALVSAALRLMEEHQVSALFVCDDEGRLAGVVHRKDLW